MARKSHPEGYGTGWLFCFRLAYTDRMSVKPWNLFDGSTRSSEEIAAERFEICQQCPQLRPATHQCRICNCFMHLKVKIEKAACPLGHW